jgi:hypothetical protein
MRRLFHNRMRMAAAITVILIAGLVETRAGGAYCRSNFRKYFEGLSVAEARVNPVERFVFSLLLSSAKPDSQAKPHSHSTEHKQL